MKKYPITGAYFFTDTKGKGWVIYSSIVDGSRYASMHDRTGLSDEEATGTKKDGCYHYGRFRREHYRQVSAELEKQQSKIIV